MRELDLRVPMADPMKCIVKIANKSNLSETNLWRFETICEEPHLRLQNNRK